MTSSSTCPRAALGERSGGPARPGAAGAPARRAVPRRVLRRADAGRTPRRAGRGRSRADRRPVPPRPADGRDPGPRRAPPARGLRAAGGRQPDAGGRPTRSPQRSSATSARWARRTRSRTAPSAAAATSFQEAMRLYSSAFPPRTGRVRATFELVFLTGWAPDDSQPKPLRPGSATTRLADALGRDRAARRATRCGGRAIDLGGNGYMSDTTTTFPGPDGTDDDAGCPIAA
jgi:hypothetical protein